MVKFTDVQTDLLIGTLLGDGNLQTNNGQTWRLRVIHKAAHQPYIMHKYSIFKDFCSTGPTYAKVLDERTQKEYERYYFNTLFSDEFRFFGQLFYEKEKDGSWKKHISKNIHKFITPRALAYWYMDDGAMKWKGKSNAVRLCTDSFSSDEVHILKASLEKNFHLKTSIQKQGSHNRICILERSYPKLKELIAPYLLPSMYYKFPDGNMGVYQGEDISNDIFNTSELREISADYREL